MGKEILVNVGRTETRAAILEDGHLVELYVERDSNQRVAGNIYKARVANVLPGMQAAFVDIGLERNAFLYVDDLGGYLHSHEGESPDLEDEPVAVLPVRSHSRKKKISELLKEGQEIVVQVTKDPIGTKGARVVTHLSLPGRYLVLMPTVDYIGISRRIENQGERDRLKTVAKKTRPRGMGLIVRTVAEGQDEAELGADCRLLLHMWEKIRQRARRQSAPALLYKDYDLIYRLLRDVLSTEVDQFVVDNKTEYHRALELAKGISPALKDRIKLYTEDIPLFESRNLETEIQRAFRRKVWLPSGGYLIIDEMEALTSIDVNTGKFVGSTNLADTVLRTNLEATREIARQLRLRNLGGIIIVDFIDMDKEEDRKQVLGRLEQETRHDRTKTHILGFTQLGLVEITRKKTRESITSVIRKPCPYCDGTGRVMAEETVAAQAERELRKLVRMKDVEAVLLAVHPSVAALLIGAGGANLRRLEEELGKSIFVKGNDRLHTEEIKVLAAGSRQEVEARAMPVHEGQVLEVEVEEPHVSNTNDGIARLEGYVLNIEGAGHQVGERLKVQVTKVFRTYARGRVVGPASLNGADPSASAPLRPPSGGASGTAGAGSGMATTGVPHS